MIKKPICCVDHIRSSSGLSPCHKVCWNDTALLLPLLLLLLGWLKSHRNFTHIMRDMLCKPTAIDRGCFFFQRIIQLHKENTPHTHKAAHTHAYMWASKSSPSVMHAWRQVLRRDTHTHTAQRQAPSVRSCCIREASSCELCVCVVSHDSVLTPCECEDSFPTGTWGWSQTLPGKRHDEETRAHSRFLFNDKSQNNKANRSLPDVPSIFFQCIDGSQFCSLQAIPRYWPKKSQTVWVDFLEGYGILFAWPSFWNGPS